jgi:hypothetical protein
MITPSWVKRNIPRIWGRRRPRTNPNTPSNPDAPTPPTSTQQQEQEEEEDPNDLTSITSLVTKLKALHDRAQSKLQSQNALSVADTQIAFLALVQLVHQFKTQFSIRRDERYHNSMMITGDSSDNNVPEMNDTTTTTISIQRQMEGFDEYFELADWAYNEFTTSSDQSLSKALSTFGYVLVRHDEKKLVPGYVAHYIALHKDKKQVVIAIKGTSSFEDMLTDCCGSVVPYTCPHGPFVNHKGPTTTIHCHEGILLAAQKLFQDVETVMEELFLPNQYHIVITGHSLGAGVSTLLGILLRSRFPALRDDTNKGTKRLQVLAFASPPVVDYETSLACTSFCTTIVNNSDIIPRSSLANLVVMMEFLKILNHKLEVKGFKPTNFTSAGKFLNMLVSTNTSSSENDMIMSADEIKQGMEDAFEKVDMTDPDHLYVAGTVFHMYDLWSKTGYDQEVEATIEKEALDKAQEGGGGSGSIHQSEAEKDLSNVRTAEKVYKGQGISNVLRFIELDARMLTDHLSPAYRSSLRTLLSDVQKRSPKVEAYYAVPTTSQE